MKILMVAADPMEFTGVLRHAGDMKSLSLAADWVRAVHLGNHQVVLVANGAGARRAAFAVEAAWAAFPAEAVVSVGFCGALAPELEVADVVVGTSIATGSGTFTALHPAAGRPHHMGVVRSIDHVVQTSAEKRSLHASGAAAVEMEAAGVAERARTLGLPFYCVRAVTDLAAEDLSNDFNRALRPDGHFATMDILRGTLRSPLVRVPELIRLRNRCVRGDFIADCRF